MGAIYPSYHDTSFGKQLIISSYPWWVHIAYSKEKKSPNMEQNMYIHECTNLLVEIEICRVPPNFREHPPRQHKTFYLISSTESPHLIPLFLSPLIKSQRYMEISRVIVDQTPGLAKKDIKWEDPTLQIRLN